MISLRTVAVAFLALAPSALSGTTIWSGSFDSYSSSADFDKWSWGSQVGEYQWYIKGSKPTSQYLNVSPSYKNPADTAEPRGLKLTVDSTSQWNGGFQRSELIPQTTANLGQGHLFYHFSVSHSSTNPPVTSGEHQVLFFESHFTEFKIGTGSDPTALVWHVGGQPQYSVPFTAGTWYNFAYDIDFSAKTVALWASTAGNPLTKVHAAVSASTSTNSADWHLGVLRLNPSSAAEDWYFSGVYIESGSITTAIGNGSTPPPSSSAPTVPSSSSSSTAVPVTSTTSPTTTVAPPQTTVVPTTSSAPTAYAAHYGQCGGNGYTGPTTCASPYTCKDVSPPYYSQCL